MTALGDPTRRDIFERLAERPRAVGELAGELPVLKEARLVSDQQVGTRRIYRVDPDGLEALRAYLDHFWDQALAGYRSAVERAMKESE